MTALFLLFFGVVILVPTWLVLPPDDEDLSKEIVSTVFQSKQLFSGHYPFWDPWVAFGVPQPPTQSLVFHPFLVLTEFLPLGAAIGLLYQIQLWIGLFSIWAVARYLGLRRPLAVLGVVTYALCSTTLMYLSNFWPVMIVDWTLAPLLLLLVLHLLDADGRAARATFSIATGLCAGFMVLDGHAPSLVDYALPFVVFVAFAIWPKRRLLELWLWVGVSLAVLLTTVASDLYGIWFESTRAVTARNNQETVAMNVWRLFLYPISSPFHQGNYSRALAIGGPFFVLAAVGLVYPLRHRYANALRAGAIVAFAQWFVPVRWTTIRGGNLFSSGPITLFALLLAALTLQALWARFPAWRRILVAAAALQVVALVAGYYPYYRDGIAQARAYYDGSPSSHSLRRVLEDQPIYRYFERRPGIGRTRVYMAPGADKRLFRKAPDYRFPGWSLHGLRLVNGQFKGIDMHEITPARVYLRGEIRGDARVAGSATTLDALGIGYVLATPDDRVASTLRPIRTFRLQQPPATIVAYRNPYAWPDAVLLGAQPRRLAELPRRAGCPTPGLLCADFASVQPLPVRTTIREERWDGTTLLVKLTPAARPRVLMLSQLYRPGWVADLSNGRSVEGHRLFGAFVGFDVPAGVHTTRIGFRPTVRIALTALSWFTIAAGFLALAVMLFAAGRRKLQRGGRL